MEHSFSMPKTLIYNLKREKNKSNFKFNPQLLLAYQLQRIIFFPSLCRTAKNIFWHGYKVPQLPVCYIGVPESRFVGLFVLKCVH